MGMLRKQKPKEAEIPTSSMADIAFLLLVFFLVVTTIDVDTGIGIVLPPPPDTNQPPPQIQKRNILNILVNSAGQVLVNDEESSLSQIRNIAKKHITNNGIDPKLSISPDKALISVKVDRDTQYNIFIRVYDEINMAYRDLRFDEARKRYGLGYERLTDEQKKNVDEMYKKKISFAEPNEK